MSAFSKEQLDELFTYLIKYKQHLEDYKVHEKGITFNNTFPFYNISGTEVFEIGQTGVDITGALTTTSTINGATLNNVAWSAYTPVFTNITLGSATMTAAVKQIGKLVWDRGFLKLAADSSVDGTVTKNLPITSITYPGNSLGPQIGFATFRDATGPLIYYGADTWTSTTTSTPRVFRVDATYAICYSMNGTIPITWTTDDELYWESFYEAA